MEEINNIKEHPEYQELYDKYIRLCAEFDNYRKRTGKEKEETIRLANERLILEELDVLDDLEAALKYMTDKEGMSLIKDKFQRILEKNGLEKIETNPGDPFNPDIHNAVLVKPAESEESRGKITHVLMTGYSLNGKIIRHTNVAVGQ